MASLLFALTAPSVAAPPAGVGGGKEKMTVCHKGKTITISAPAAKGHVKHGGTPGACGTTTGGTTGDTTASTGRSGTATA